ncbi:MAG: ribonuclease H-like YkuK family protein [Patescibacteria group bacterium]
MDRLFNTSVGLKMSPEQIVREMIAFMQADDTRKYKIIIGSDSERKASGSADFVTAIVIHRVGNGGRYFWRRTVLDRKFHTLRDRIWEEVIMSLDVARELLDTAKKFEMPPYDFEIHVDVGENGATRVMIQELVGMVRAQNFEAKTKPESYAASKVADRHV